ncbi:hypothetical protein BH10ACT8_BH10ACT8_05780 [soil metagenome]|jgi:hypothetical protein
MVALVLSLALLVIAVVTLLAGVFLVQRHGVGLDSHSTRSQDGLDGETQGLEIRALV